MKKLLPKTKKEKLDDFPLTKKEEQFLYRIMDKLSETCKKLCCDVWYWKVVFFFTKKASIYNEEQD